MQNMDEELDEAAEEAPETAPSSRRWILIGCGVLAGLGLLGAGGLAVLLIAVRPQLNEAIERSKIAACQANLRQIYRAMLSYQIMYKQKLDESGAKFLAQLYNRNAMEQTKANALRLTCPSVELGSLTIGRMESWEEWWANPDLVDGSYTAYAARNYRDFPIEKLPAPADEPLIACDNDPCMNHRDVTNVLYGDGRVVALSLTELKATGVVPPDAEMLVVGPGSPLEDLRKLSLD
ncbi:MAG: hypothetical protein O7B99_08265 [Planctomycetota bacterium]|nr:hypothetical protein [Planctomycetota bacterium]